MSGSEVHRAVRYFNSQFTLEEVLDAAHVWKIEQLWSHPWPLGTIEEHLMIVYVGDEPAGVVMDSLVVISKRRNRQKVPSWRLDLRKVAIRVKPARIDVEPFE